MGRGAGGCGFFFEREGGGETRPLAIHHAEKHCDSFVSSHDHSGHVQANSESAPAVGAGGQRAGSEESEASHPGGIHGAGELARRERELKEGTV